ncbi:MAG: CPBP family intramembrane metalloprotease [Bacteroidales bacterium]|jgi:membrane protease YdiL (CAAX protease family)|nr:CPBP family intramembrane metalloprotease [Bacteroidales bacterium]
MNYLKAYGILLLNTLTGLAIMILNSFINIPNKYISVVLMLSLFVISNIIYAYCFKLTDDIKKYWSLRKSYFILPGIITGLIIAYLPITLGLITGKTNFSALSFYEITISSLIITFLIVSWEELWFRGILLNYCKKFISYINISVASGILFMLMHIMNPNINLLTEGPSLFFAGALLTILYLYYKNIWLPIGIHFGNNFFNSLVDYPLKDDIWFGEEKLISSFVTAILFIIFVIKVYKKNINNAAK